MSANKKPILRLSEETINRIAAGEIAQRPSSVVKELIENSLDAGATSISVSCKGGGLDFLQIQDNGHGIPKESLGIVCERFTTSKISSFEDLNTIGTFGFRGEALASVTHVSHVTITTKTSEQKCAYKARYIDGKLSPIKSGDNPEPKPCAGVTGTIIVVEDLFYNMINRRQAFKNIQEEFQRILDVLTKYAIHFSKVSFICKKTDKSNGNAISLHTLQDSSIKDNIGLIYGQAVARELLDLSFESETECDGLEDQPQFVVSGFVSNANYSCKKSTFIIFINNRAVACLSVQRCVEAVYKNYLPKHTHPFVYLSIEMPPQHVDVNVHPTKKEVHFLFEDELLNMLQKSLTAKLEGANESRVFFTQTLLPSVPGPSQDNNGLSQLSLPKPSVDNGDSIEEGPVTSKKRGKSGRTATPAYKFVRTDPSLQAIDNFFSKNSIPREKSRQEQSPLPDESSEIVRSTSQGESTQKVENAQCDLDNDVSEVSWRGCYKLPILRETSYDYTSIQTLWKEVTITTDHSLQSVIRHNTLVGVIDEVYLLIQCGTQLILVDHSRLTYHLFWQLSLRQFGVMPRMKLNQPVDVLRYIMNAIDTEVAACEEAGVQRSEEERREVSMALTSLLESKSEMLSEYFRIKFTKSEGNLYLESLPELLQGYRPVPEALPLFLYRLATEVNWEEELECFKGVCTELSLYYCALPSESPSQTGESSESQISSSAPASAEDANNDCTSSSDLSDDAKTILINQLWPALKSYLLPPKDLATNGSFVVIAALEQLYKVFERC